MARPQPNEPDPPPATASGGESERSVREVAAEAPAPDVSSAPGGALLRALLATGMDAAAAYTAVREMESTAGHNVVVQLGAQIQAFASEVRNDLTEVKSRLTGMESRLTAVESGLAAVESRLAAVEAGVAEVNTDVAVLKREVRLIWLLLIPILISLLVRLFAV